VRPRRFRGGVQTLEEAAAPARMAGDAALLLHLEQDDVGVAVQADLPHALVMTRFLALAPQTLARARPVDRPARGGGLGERFGGHPRDHRYRAVGGVLGDGGNQAVFVEAHGLEPARQGVVHAGNLTLTPWAARNSFACCTVYSP